MTWLNLSDAHNQLAAAGLLLGTARNGRNGTPAGDLWIDSSKPVRCQVEGGGRELRGWYWLSTFVIRGADYVTGSYGVYQGTDPGKRNIEVRLDGRAVEQSREERDAQRRRNAERARQAAEERRQEAARAAAAADRVWRAYVATGRSDYLERKGVGAHGLRFDPAGAGTVAVPMLRDRHVVGLQIIRGKARGRKLEKEYWPAGMDKSGAHHTLGRIRRGGVVIVCEGYATGASIFEAMGQQIPVVVAFDAVSLGPVCEQLGREHGRLRLVVAADDDYLQRCRAEVANPKTTKETA